MCGRGVFQAVVQRGLYDTVKSGGFFGCCSLFFLHTRRYVPFKHEQVVAYIVVKRVCHALALIFQSVDFLFQQMLLGACFQLFIFMRFLSGGHTTAEG
ncbi:hypothetical protein Barb4_05332 [Bacteroidales bacterium Barb4]|nr:hypothetical protein Barb4_05332 [Bacteroidales bacterium Barb4]